jgi:hypothetical protein
MLVLLIFIRIQLPPPHNIVVCAAVPLLPALLASLKPDIVIAEFACNAENFVADKLESVVLQVI